jgi:phage terminase large subunit
MERVVVTEEPEETVRLLRELTAKIETRFAQEMLDERMRTYRTRPERFAAEVLGSHWWSRQKDAAELVAKHRRVAVKSANGVGKTYLAADLALWFLYTHRPSIVLTTAPTWRQVRYLLWEEIRKRFRSLEPPLPGRLLNTRLSAAEGWFALGLATDDPVKFQGFHADNLLIIFDEASGIPDSIWEAAEGVAVGKTNKVLAIGNPLTTTGRFYKLFKSQSGWRRQTISALSHPNITEAEPAIPGAVTPEAIDERVQEWATAEEEGECGSVGEGECGRGGVWECGSVGEGERTAATFEWRGRRYRPNGMFRSRVLGEFPDSDEDTLIPLRWIEEAVERKLPADGCRRAAVDVARFGSDSTVIGLRAGSRVIRMDVVQGADLMEVSGRAARLAFEERPESIAVDVVGLGSGVVDRLVELGIDGLAPFNGGESAHNRERFANRRAEVYWAMRERFRTGDISIPRDETLVEELAGLKYQHTSRGQIKMESKDEMKRRGMKSPDRADMLSMLFDSAFDGPSGPTEPRSREPSHTEAFRSEMRGW